MMLWDPLNAWPKGRRWLWAVLAVLVCLTQGSVFLRNLRPARDHWTDFFQEWASARNYCCGLPIYSDHQLAVERHLGYDLETEEPDPCSVASMSKVIRVNAHPPTAVLLTLPLAFFDYPDAVLFWNLFSLGAFFLCLWLVVRALSIPVSVWSVLPLVTLILLCGPFREQAVQAQLNLILLLLLTGTWIAHRSGRPITAGVLLGLAVAIKLFPAFMFVYFVLLRRWTTVAVGMVALVAVTGLTGAVFGVNVYMTYARDVVPQVAVFRSGWGNASLPGVWTKLFAPVERECVEPLWWSPLLCQTGTWLSGGVLVGALAWCGIRARGPAEEDRVFALSMTTMLLVSPLTWAHYLLLLLVPLALVWFWLPATTLARGAFLTILTLLWVTPGLLHQAFIPGGRLSGMATPVHTLALLSLQCYGLLGLFVLLAWLSPQGNSMFRQPDRTVAEITACQQRMRDALPDQRTKATQDCYLSEGVGVTHESASVYP